MIDLATSLPTLAHSDEHPMEPAIRLVSRVAGPLALVMLSLAAVGALVF